MEKLCIESAYLQKMNTSYLLLIKINIYLDIITGQPVLIF